MNAIVFPEVTLEGWSQKEIEWGFACSYVVARLVDDTGANKIVFFAHADHQPYHRYGFQRVKDIAAPLKVQCLGGGTISVHGERYSLFGSSGDFGTDNKKQTAQMLRRAFPDCVVTIDEF